MVYSVCLENNLPLVITMGGGYSRPMTGEHLKVCMESYDKGILFMCCQVRNYSPFLS